MVTSAFVLLLINNKNKANVTIEKFKREKSLEFLYEKK